MTTATQQLAELTPRKIVEQDERHRRNMALCNQDFERALDRYFRAREWRVN